MASVGVPAAHPLFNTDSGLMAIDAHGDYNFEITPRRSHPETYVRSQLCFGFRIGDLYHSAGIVSRTAAGKSSGLPGLIGLFSTQGNKVSSTTDLCEGAL